MCVLLNTWALRWVLACALCILTVGCQEQRPATQVLVVINSNLTTAQLSEVEVQVLERSGRRGDDPHSLRRIAIGEEGTAGQHPLPFSFAVTPKEGVTKGRFRLIVIGFDEQGEESVEHQVVSGFREGETLLLSIFLHANCLYRLCHEEQAAGSDVTCDYVTTTCEPVQVRTNLPTVEPGQELSDAVYRDAGSSVDPPGLGESDAGAGGTCKPGYIPDDAMGCVDRDECREDPSICAPNPCTNHPGSYACGNCNAGEEPDGDGGCQDINECKGNHDCDATAQCVNEPGSYRCECADGLELSGTACVEVNECMRDLDDCDDKPEACVDLPAAQGGFTCECPDGYDGQGVGTTGCQDINECDNASACPQHSTCNNVPGGFECPCAQGYEQSGDTCVNIDECTRDLDDCDDDPDACVDSDGGFTCECPNGYRGNGKGLYGCDCDPQVQSCPVIVVESTAGDDFACARLNDGTAWCWGANGAGQLGDGSRQQRTTPVQVGSDTDWDQISAGGAFACGRRGDSLYCWGINSNGEVGKGTTTLFEPITALGTGYTLVSAGGRHSCGIRGGQLHCWGANSQGQLGDGSTVGPKAPTRVGTESDWTDVDAGRNHTCGIRAGGMYCWGNLSGSSLPKRIGAANDWWTVAAGDDVTCGLRGAGNLYCWGSNFYGEAAYDLDSYVASPTRVGADSDWREIASERGHTCGIRGGELYCWGRNFEGQLGGASPLASVLSPTRVGSATDWRTIATGDRHTCGVRNDRVYCWGRNLYGQRGDGSDSGYETPQLVDAGPGWTGVSAGSEHTCALKSSSLYCWGNGFQGRLGTGDLEMKYVPTRVGSASDWGNISAGSQHTCGRRGNDLYCFGTNFSGLIGDGTTDDKASPTRVITPGAWTDVSARGEWHTCGISEGGGLYCWGAIFAPSTDLLGDGLGTGTSTPSQEAFGALNWTQVAIGYDHSCGIRGGQLYCWGNNATGEIGEGGQETSYAIPERVGAQSDWDSVAVGHNATCGIRSGELYCWGQGYLGDGSPDPRNTPTRIGSASDWTAVTTRGGTQCGINAAGLYCWGDNGSGEVGDGTRRNAKSTPVQIDAAAWTAISTGGTHTCGTKAGALYCWGASSTSQLGLNEVPQPTLVPLP